MTSQPFSGHDGPVRNKPLTPAQRKLLETAGRETVDSPEKAARIYGFAAEVVREVFAAVRGR